MKKVIIIDYGVGNLLSLKMAIEFLGVKAEITNEKKNNSRKQLYNFTFGCVESV